VSNIIVERLHVDVDLPSRATEGAAGYDLRAYLTGRTIRCSDGVTQWQSQPEIRDGVAVLVLPEGAMALVPLGFKARLPQGFEAQIRPRSGAAFKKGLHVANTPGTVDCDYPDEWMVPVRNGARGPLEISHGERIAQMVLARYEVLSLVDGEVGTTTSRTGGFGSTGS
jgi:dUTP pyrophosphatase